MASITSEDLRAIFGFLSMAAKPAPGDPFPRHVLAHLGEVIPADWTEFFEIRRADHGGTYTTSVDIDELPEHDCSPGSCGLHDNPIGAFKWDPVDGPQRLSALAGPHALRRLGYFAGYLRPMGIRDQLKVWLWSTDRSAVCLVLNRADGTFSDADAAILGVLQPHLFEIWQAAARPPRDRQTHVDLPLTLREAQVLSWVAAGRQTSEVASLLFISPATARKHLENAYAKLGVRGRSEALASIMRLSPRDPAAPAEERSLDP